MTLQDYTLVALVSAVLAHLATRRLAIHHGYDRPTWRAVAWSALLGAAWPATAVVVAVWLLLWPSSPVDAAPAAGSVPRLRDLAPTLRIPVRLRPAAAKPSQTVAEPAEQPEPAVDAASSAHLADLADYLGDGWQAGAHADSAHYDWRLQGPDGMALLVGNRFGRVVVELLPDGTVGAREQRYQITLDPKKTLDVVAAEVHRRLIAPHARQTAP